MSVHPSVSPSACLSVTPFCCCHQCIIMKFSRGFTIERSDVVPNLGISGPKLQFEFTDGYAIKHRTWSGIEVVLCWFSRSSLYCQGCTGQKKSSILTRTWLFRTVTAVWIHRWLLNDAQSSKWHRRSTLLLFKDIHQISRSHGTKNINFDLNWTIPDCNSSLNSLMVWNNAQSLL